MVRISGLASGMDIDSMVKQLMTAERMPLDKLNQKKQTMEWQRDDYRDMNSTLLDLDTTIFNGVGKQSSFIKKNVTISDSNMISVRNVNSTSDFSGRIEVKELASPASITSKTATNVTDSTAKLTVLAGKTITVQAITKDGTLEDKPFSYTIKADDTLDSVISQINSNSGVTAFFDQNTKQVSFTAKNTGQTSGGKEIIFTGDEFFKNTLNVDLDNATSTLGNSVQGKNATIVYNGLQTTRSSNTFQINGVEITLKQKTAVNTPVTFSSAPDTDAILDTITKFVTKYNDTIKKIKDKTDEPKYRDYLPLTQEQRTSMKDDEIKLWEDKAKSGTLRNNSVLSSSLTKMRSSLYTSVPGTQTFSQLSAIGITTTSNYLDGGKLTIDEDKLRAAIAKDPNAIYNLFNKDGATSADKGLARRLRDDIKGTMTDIESKAGKTSSVNNTFTIGKLLNSIGTQITSFQDKLTSTETRYYNQFNAMEQAIQKANSQSGYLTQMLSK
ncbi:flagellar hook-associated protein 2 [Bacillus sp. OV322]|uniref:flagellar hook-associated protein 2 n=1 Tax=Bacillus sp. OV322 TaxID=1882764 RepID=UPI0008E0238C|nr:flagellar hook-associated protein 2 [Bacillus sp. OV322]SFC24243.1 flagellar hook-associated protein 2 [Bacillus sp. OV322]